MQTTDIDYAPDPRETNKHETTYRVDVFIGEVLRWVLDVQTDNYDAAQSRLDYWAEQDQPARIVSIYTSVRHSLEAHHAPETFA